MLTFPRWTRPIAVVAFLFGALTVFAGGSALFGGTEAKEMAGDAVPLVLWFNFLAGFAYIGGAIALWAQMPKADLIAWTIGLSTLAVFAILAILAFGGTAFEWRTVGAMALRSGFWLAIAFGLSKQILS